MTKELGRAKLRLEGVLAKGSDSFKNERKDDIIGIKQGFMKHTNALTEVQLRIFWSLMVEAISFTGQSFSGEKPSAEKQARVHESLSGRILQLCLTKASEFGLDNLLGDEVAGGARVLCRLGWGEGEWVGGVGRWGAYPRLCLAT